jgi:restriction system protein
MKFPEFREFREKRNTPNEDQRVEQVREEHSSQTPEEMLDETYQTLHGILAKDLLEKVKTSSPYFFEQVVIDILVAMGYGGSKTEAASLTKKTGDGGIDGIIKEDKLGLDTIYVQAKRWEGVVGRPTVQAFSGSLDGVRARKGVLMTTSYFSSDAIDYVGRIDKKIVLIDGEKLADLMIEYNVGVAESQRYIIKKVDADYFGEE